MIEINKRYIHLKTGNKYKVTDVALNCTNSNDGEELVIYIKLESKEKLTFARERSEFLEKFQLEI